MWQSAIASTIALALQQHLLFGGLGEAIAVIVGGVVSVIALRKATRSAARPAPAPRPAPASPRPATPPAFGESAPPTTPDRRLHPGPISLSAPTPPSPPDGEETGIPTTLFHPEILAADPQIAASPTPAPPVLRPLGQLSSEWRAQSSASSSSSPLDPASSLAHAPVWNHAPFARPASVVRVALDLAPEAGAAIRPPIWRAPIIAEPPAPTAAAEVTPETRAPVWASWLGSTPGSTPGSTLGASRATDAASVERFEAPGEADGIAADQTESVEPTPPIWPSFLRTE